MSSFFAPLRTGFGTVDDSNFDYGYLANQRNRNSQQANNWYQNSMFNSVFSPPNVAGGGASGGTAFNLNPAPTSGVGPFGAVPGQLGLPDPMGDLTKALPGLPKVNEAATGVLMSQLNGELSPQTVNAIQDAAARFGVSSGMPGSGLAWNRALRDLGLSVEGQQQKGLQNYGPFIGTVSGTQTLNPGLQAEIANTNAINAAAPDPTKAASYAQMLFQQYLQSIGGGGPAGGTGAFSNPYSNGVSAAI